MSITFNYSFFGLIPSKQILNNLIIWSSYIQLYKALRVHNNHRSIEINAMLMQEILVTSQPTSRHSKGDISYKSTANGKVGWVCVAAGTPGTWKPFGVIEQ